MKHAIKQEKPNNPAETKGKKGKKREKEKKEYNQMTLYAGIQETSPFALLDMSPKNAKRALHEYHRRPEAARNKARKEHLAREREAKRQKEKGEKI